MRLVCRSTIISRLSDSWLVQVGLPPGEEGAFIMFPSRRVFLVNTCRLNGQSSTRARIRVSLDGYWEDRIVYGFPVSFRYLWKLITKLELQRLYQAFLNEFSYYQLYLSFSFVLFILLVFWNGYKKWRWQYKLGIPLKW